MGFNKLLERLGFVRLRDYGLLLTVDGRIVTTRKILDDGFGAVVVGYSGGDLAALELAPEAKAPPIEAPPPLPFAPTVAARVVPAPQAPVVTAPIAPVVAAPVVAAAPVAAPMAAPVAAPPEAAAAEPAAAEPSEDEWEWEIAMARARAEAANAALSEVTQTQLQVRNPWHEETTTVRNVEPPPAATRDPQPRLSGIIGAPRTIIPVPTLPVANDAQTVVRQLPIPRLARGTGSLRG